MRKRYDVGDIVTIEAAEEMLKNGVANECEDGIYVVPVVDERGL